jgi:DNA uptake protein ComE-like DNA-binding protein
MSSAFRTGIFWMAQVLALSIAATSLASDEPPKSAIKLLRKKVIPTAPVGLNPLAGISRPVARIDINTATLQQLMQLSGVTLPIANHIIAARPYRATMDLVARHIIEKTDFDKIGMQLTASTRHQPED